MNNNFFHSQVIKGSSKIVMLILDGLGGLPQKPGGKTELESADRPNLNALAAKSSLGLTVPVGPGITVGSGPGHLAIFGYDPTTYDIGRGTFEALGVDFDLQSEDIAARGNFCTVSHSGAIVDRRAGRIPSSESRPLVEILNTIQVDGAEIFVTPVKEHRFSLVLRGRGLGYSVTDTDPYTSGNRIKKARATQLDSIRTAEIVNQFADQAAELLSNQPKANNIMLRGFSKLPEIPPYQEIFKLNPAAIAINGMYKGVARLVGMDVLTVEGTTLSDEFSTLEKHWDDYDFFYLHFKKTDTCGEDGDFAGKVKAIEEFDAQIPRLLALNPDVVIIGGDHSSPAIMKSHSWHPVPLLLYSKWSRTSGNLEFGEKACALGSLGTIPANTVMPIALAHAGRVEKYGA